MRVLVMCLAGMILGAGGLIYAEEAGEQCGQKGKHGKKFLEKYDKDGDGKLSEEERAAAKEAWMLKRYDKDGDGKLSEEEKKAMRKAHGGKWKHHDDKTHGGCKSAEGDQDAHAEE